MKLEIAGSIFLILGNIRAIWETATMNVSILIALISGAAGGNFAGGTVKSLNLGLFGNTIFGVLGGYLGLLLLKMFKGGVSTASFFKDGANASDVIAIMLASGLVGAFTTLVLGAARNRLNGG